MSKLYRDEETLNELYHNEGLTQVEISDELDCSTSTISNWMAKFDVEVNRCPTEHLCDNCGGKFNRPPSNLTGEKKFCGRDCEHEFKRENTPTGEDHREWSGGKDSFICDECGDEYKQYSFHVRGDVHFCSHECRAKSNRVDGDLHYGPNWSEIRKTAIEKCDGVCNYDGCKREKTQDGRSLHVHHLTPLRKFESCQEANKLSNLVALCAEHHRKIETND